MNTKNTQLGLVLSGGGARGIAHIGVLQALVENGVEPQIISAASMGSVVGTFYAAGKSPAEIMDLFRHVKLLEIFKIQRPTLGLTDLSFLRKVMTKTLGEKIQFEDLQKKLYVSVSNLQSGEFEIIHEGNLIESVVASSSIPMLFKPVMLNGKPYVDGGLINNFPVEPLLHKTSAIIGVSVVAHGPKSDSFDSFAEVAERCFSLYNYQNVKPRLPYCDVVIEPKGITDFHIFDFKKSAQIYQRGYDSTIEMMPTILKVLGR